MVKSVELSFTLRGYEVRNANETIPSQAGNSTKLLGVCNEHEPSAKAKMCSELHGDMKRLAEMISPAVKAGNRQQYKVHLLASTCEKKYGTSRS